VLPGLLAGIQTMRKGEIAEFLCAGRYLLGEPGCALLQYRGGTKDSARGAGGLMMGECVASAFLFFYINIPTRTPK